MVSYLMGLWMHHASCCFVFRPFSVGPPYLDASITSLLCTIYNIAFRWMTSHTFNVYIFTSISKFVLISFHWKNIKWISKKNAAFLSRFSKSLLWQTNFLIFKLVLDDNQFNVPLFFCIILIGLSFLMIFLIFYYLLYNLNTN